MEFEPTDHTVNALKEAFSIEKFEQEGPFRISTSLEILKEVGALKPIDLQDASGVVPHWRFGIEGANGSGKSAAVREMLDQYSAISNLYFPENEDFHFVTMFREPPLLPLESVIRESLQLQSEVDDYRKLCMGNFLQHPFQQALAFMIARNRVHYMSSLVKDRYKRYLLDDIKALLSEDVRIPKDCLESVRRNMEDYLYIHLYRMRHIEDYKYPIEFFHDRTQISTLIYQTEKIHEMSGLPYRDVFEIVYNAHKYLEEERFIDPFNGFLIIFDKDNTPYKTSLVQLNRNGKQSEVDQYEALFSQKEEMIRYSQSAKLLREKGHDVVIIENSKFTNTKEQLGGAISHFFSSVISGKDILQGVKIRESEYVDLENKGLINVNLGELKIRNGIMKWEPRKEWYENFDITSLR